MTKEGRLQRGKENLEYKNLDGTIGRFADNPETLEYLSEKPKLEKLEKEKKEKLEKEKKAREMEAKKNAPSTQ